MGDGAALSSGESSSLPSRIALAVVFVLALGLRLSAVGTYDEAHPQADLPLIDEAAYEDWALEIAGGEWLGDEIFFQEPLYPYSLAVVYAAAGDAPSGRRAARRLQAVLGALTAVLVGLLGRRVFDRRAGLVAAGLWAVWGPAVWMSCLLLKPNLFLPLFTLLGLLLVDAGAGTRRSRWVSIGLLVGLGALLRGNMLLLVPAFLLFPPLRARLEGRASTAALGASAAVLAGVLLVLLPVALRNLAVGGKLVLSTSGAGTNVYGGNNPDNPYGIAKEFDWVRGIPAYEADDWRHEAERRTGRALDAAETSSFWLAETRRSLGADPLAHLRIFWNKLRLSIGAYEVPDNHFYAWDARYVPLLRWLPGFVHVGWVGLMGLMLLGWGGREHPGRTVLAALFLLYLATIVLTVTSARVRLALVPVVLVFAGGLVSALPGLARARPRHVAGALIVSLLAVAVPVLPAQMRASDLDERDFNLASQLLDAGDLDAAAPLLRALAVKHPASTRVVRRNAELDYRRTVPEIAAAGAANDRPRLLELQDRVEAILGRLVAVASGSNPRERFRTQALIGGILQDQGQWKAAASAFEAALEFDPEDGDLRRRLALCWAEAAMQEPDPEARAAGLERAATALEALHAETGQEAVLDLAKQIRGRL